METLALKLAEILEVTVDKAIELLPMIQEQFIIYRIIDIIATSTMVVTIFLGVFVIAITLYYFAIMEYLDESYKGHRFYGSEHELAVTMDKMIRPTWILFAILIVLNTILSVLPYIFSPEFMLIKEFLN